MRLGNSGFEASLNEIRTSEELCDFEPQNVLKISPNLSLSVLMNFVLIKKECTVYCAQCVV